MFPNKKGVHLHGAPESGVPSKDSKPGKDTPKKSPALSLANNVTEHNGSGLGLTPAMINALSDALERLLRYGILGIILLVLVIGALSASFWKPQIAKDIWIYVGPIITLALGYLAGKGSGVTK